MNIVLLRSAALLGGLAFSVAGAWAATSGHDAHSESAEHGGAAHATTASVTGPQSTTVSAADCWIRMLPSPAPSGGFLLIRNSGSQDAAVTGASSPDYGMVMVHQTTEDKGMSKMAMVHEVVIPAGEELAFKPGSYHVMLEQPARAITVGEHVQLDLALANGERVSASCEIKPPTALKY